MPMSGSGTEEEDTKKRARDMIEKVMVDKIHKDTPEFEKGLTK